MADDEQLKEDQRRAQERADKFDTFPRFEPGIAALLTAAALGILLTVFSASLGVHPDVASWPVFIFTALGGAAAFFITRWRQKIWTERYDSALSEFEMARRHREESIERMYAEMARRRSKEPPD